MDGRELLFGGHRDDGNPLQVGDHTNNDDPEHNMGNFKALLKYGCESGDIDLQSHLESYKKNASYISKTAQNDLLDCIKDHIQYKIVNEIMSQEMGPFYGISADEVTDVSNWEQLGLVLRYVKDGKPIERVIEYMKCDKTTGDAISDQIVNALKSLKLDPKNCRSQTYDGAGNMAGHLNGAAKNFQNKTQNERAPYFHCASHD